MCVSDSLGDPVYIIAYLCQKAAHFSDRLAALSLDQPMLPSMTVIFTQSVMDSKVMRSTPHEGQQTHTVGITSWDTNTQYFIDNCICKGFATYDDAANW